MKLRVPKYINFIETVIKPCNLDTLSVLEELYCNACCCKQEEELPVV